MKIIVKKFLFINSYLFFSLLDTIFWLIIKILPNRQTLKLVKFRNWNLKILKIPTNKKIKSLIIKIVNLRNKRATLLSSCLSRSLSARVLLDLIYVENELKLGININKNGRRIPHAWLIDSATGNNITPGLKKNKELILKNY